MSNKDNPWVICLTSPTNYQWTKFKTCAIELNTSADDLINFNWMVNFASDRIEHVGRKENASLHLFSHNVSKDHFLTGC